MNAIDLPNTWRRDWRGNSFDFIGSDYQKSSPPQRVSLQQYHPWIMVYVRWELQRLSVFMVNQRMVWLSWLYGPTDHRSSFEFWKWCESGCWWSNGQTLMRLFQKYSVLSFEKSDYWLNSQGRIAQPMILEVDATLHTNRLGRCIPIHCVVIQSMESPKSLLHFGRTSNEAAFLYQALVRALGTNNLPDCSNMCHESSGKALTETIGIGKGLSTSKTSTILIWFS